MKTLLIVGLGLLLGCGGGAMKTSVDAAVEAAVDLVAPGEVFVVEAGLTTVNYRVTRVEGTFGGDAVNVTTMNRTDTLAVNTCTYSSPGTVASQMLFIGAADLTKIISLSGTTTCPAGMATSTAAAACTSQAVNGMPTMFQGSIEMAGWADDSVVTFKIAAPPGAPPGCNYANVVIAASQPWGIAGTTTAGKFKALTPFTVPFMGSKMLTLVTPTGTTTSNVSWDFTMTVEPIVP